LDLSTRAHTELQRINRELADILHVEPVDLSLGADVAARDELVICGLLGGKDVGKSTLINALAKTEVSTDTAEAGKGTERPMAYVHEAAHADVVRRLTALDRNGTIDVTTHQADQIRNVVLVDLPDFDSDFLEHLDTVRTIAPLLDRILWVVTPRKIGDRAWVQLLPDVVKDPSNVHCVLNKVDQLLSDGELRPEQTPTPNGNGRSADAFWEMQHRWVMQCLQATDCPDADDHRFLVAAAFAQPDAFVARVGHVWDDPEWKRYTLERKTVHQIARLASAELDRLRARVLSPVSKDEQGAVKASNRAREQHVNVDRIKDHFELNTIVSRLARACDPTYHQLVLNEAVGPDYCAAVGAAVATQLRSTESLADELLTQRVAQWPLLRLVHWPFGWVSRALGRRVGIVSRTSATDATDPLQTSGPTVKDRIDLIRSRVLADHAVAIRRVRAEDEFPQSEPLTKRVTSAIRSLPDRLETQLLGEALARYRRPSLFAKTGLWLILLWFPLLQPILAGTLEMIGDSGGWRTAHGLYRIVSALSAAHLLAGLAVVVVIYVAILAGMYARASRAIRRARDELAESSLIADAVDHIFISHVVAPIVQPINHRLERLAELQRRLEDS
jgi:hypothetical protein